MRKYTIEELVDINELFNGSQNIAYSILNKYVYLEVGTGCGSFATYIIPKREFRLIQQNFYISDMAEIIEMCIEGKKSVIFTKYEDEEFPLSINVYGRLNQLVKQIKCNEDEHYFIYKCVRNQKNKV